MTRRANDETGSISAFMAVVAIALVMVAGMAYDGGQVISAHNAARNDAEQAARAGAQQIDLTHLRKTNEPRLDSAKAESAALDYLAQTGSTGTVAVTDASVTVTVSGPSARWSKMGSIANVADAAPAGIATVPLGTA